MIIKLYARGATPHLHIIEGVSQVSVDARTTKSDVFGFDGAVTTQYEHLNHDDEDCRLITFVSEGTVKSLLVYNKAYICNDEGKTIEAVIVDIPKRNDCGECKEA